MSEGCQGLGRVTLGGWAPIERFDLPQVKSDGTVQHRPIDNARRSGHNDAATAVEQLDLCSAIQPVVHVQALAAALQSSPGDSETWKKLRVESGGEDLPDAYRYVPVDPQDLNVNIVAVYNYDIADWQYQQVFGNLFGMATAVLNFNRWPRFVQAACRRLLALLFAMYFDDATLQDLAVGKGRAQLVARQFLALLGTPFAPKKSVQLGPEADFIGLVHQVDECFQQGFVSLSPRPALVEKSCGMMREALDTDNLTPGQASKIRGTLGFVFTGCFGKVGRAGFGPLVQREYSDKHPFTLSHKLRRSLYFFLELIKGAPRRLMPVCQETRRPLYIASDARLDKSSPASMAVLVYDPESGDRYGVCANLSPGLIDRWSVQEQYIELVELAAPVSFVFHNPRILEGRDVVWFIDNSAALATLVKGGSSSADMDRGSAALHLALAQLQTRIWFEYVESKANWSDSASRVMYDDTWCAQNGFHLQHLGVPEWVWTIEHDALLQTVQRQLIDSLET